MYNPLVQLSAPALTQLILQGHLYYVRQSYPRGKVDGVKAAVLITPYKTKAAADAHYASIRFDLHKYLYNIDPSTGDLLSRNWERDRLYKAAGQPAGYQVYMNLMKHRGDEWSPPRELKIQLHEASKRLGWAGRNMKVSANLTLRQGQLLVKFTNRGLVEEIPLEEIEKY